ncbi:hypothetical protein BJ138DRAFT_1119478 [Hygrophoropsis aurantiaca]|uniref:Uncharacterized protein n=1 Tax=Hygrophoropsis aurantiaca TaxID=72124 RepID=A0ACB7ZUI0_9AGAM|nr:hypothetical protein BJ138DRAFT_1119478 [Hygrophoropsis aurantiaca]
MKVLFVGLIATAVAGTVFGAAIPREENPRALAGRHLDADEPSAISSRDDDSTGFWEDVDPLPARRDIFDEENPDALAGHILTV